MEQSLVIVPVKLPDGTTFKVEATNYPGGQKTAVSEKDVAGEQGSATDEVDVAGGLPRNFDDVGATVEKIASAVLATMKKVQPKKGKVEFGLEIGLESGSLTALLVKGTGKANLKITLEW
jgi:hypothetical protein